MTYDASTVESCVINNSPHIIKLSKDINRKLGTFELARVVKVVHVTSKPGVGLVLPLTLRCGIHWSVLDLS